MTRAGARKQGRAKFMLRGCSKEGPFRTCSSSQRRADRLPGTTVGTIDTLPPSELTNGKMGAWRVNFIDPAADETSAQLIARPAGDGIEMEGKLSSGAVIRWRYVSITPRLFHYRGETMTPDGKSWRLYLELFGTRSAP